MAERSTPVLVASNRGPASFSLDADGTLSCHRGGGGLVAGLSAVSDTVALTWVCAALSDADRAAARDAPGGRLDRAGHPVSGPLRMLDIDVDTFDQAYNGIANSTLWFVHHLLYDTPAHPDFDERFTRQWDCYTAYNAAFAAALAEEAEPGARVLVQDYHLCLVPAMLRKARPDLRIAHFTHTPWAPPDYYRLLPDEVATTVLEGILGADHGGFLTRRWAEAFADCCQAMLGAAVDREQMTVTHRGRRVRLGVHPLGVDREFLRARADQPDVADRRSALRTEIGDRAAIVRVDRTELSKNIVRGLRAYREMLRRFPAWQGRVVHVALAYPSRQDLAEYRDYTAAVQRVGREICEEFATEDWTPLVLGVEDDFARSLAAYQVADVLVVNPIRDGMNLVAKEGPLLGERDAALVLSREAGAVDELGAHAITVNPYDVSATAVAMHEALSMDADQRATRTRALVTAAAALPPMRWFTDQLDALARPDGHP